MSSRMLVISFLLVQLIVSVFVVSKHNIYDDEYTSLSYVEKPVGAIVRQANSGDVHPPGMYLLTHFAYRIIPSARWMVLLTLLLWDSGLAVYLWKVTPLLPSTVSRIAFLLFATVHPQLLMWGLTTRWYGYWTGPALVLVVLALCPDSTDLRPRLSNLRAGLLGLGLALLFYINYITVVFTAALMATMVFRYGIRVWRQYALTTLVGGLLIFPQLSTMITVHMANGGGQRASSTVSLARMTEGIVTSEAFLPWHPLAILALLAGFVVIVRAAIWGVKFSSNLDGHECLVTHGELSAICIFAALLFLTESVLGFGIKPRNGMILIPLIAVPLSLVLEGFKQRWIQLTLLTIWAAWIAVGFLHLIERRGLAKASMLNRPEEVLRLIETRARASRCTVLVTYDQMLSYSAAISHTDELLLISPWPNPTPVLLPTFRLKDCATLKVYAVETATGGLGATGEKMRQEVANLRARITVSPRLYRLNQDPDVTVKRRMRFLGPDVQHLPEYRYVVNEYDISSDQLGELEENLDKFEPINEMR